MTTFTLSRHVDAGDAIDSLYRLTFDSLPGREWSYSFVEMRRELMISCLASHTQARDLLMDAYLKGEVKGETQ